jgi:hypothetical protein
MDGLPSRLRGAVRVLGVSMICAAFGVGHTARAQSSGPPEKRSSAQGERPPGGAAKRKAAGGGGANAQRSPAQNQAGAAVKRQGEPSAAYQESLRQTVERRRQRRARRAQVGARAAIGAIVPWPMPPALIIRHTPDVHSEVEALLNGLRYGSVAR